MLAVAIPVAKYFVETLIKGAGGKITTTLIFEMMLGNSTSAALAKLDKKVDAVLQGQEEIKGIIGNLPSRIALKSALDDMYNRVHGVLIAIKSGSPTDQEYADLNRFLALTGRGSCRGITDNICQKLFGAGNITPDSFWIADGEPGKAGVLQDDSHIRAVNRTIFEKAGNVLEINELMQKQMAAFAEMVSFFCYLAAAYQATHEFLSRNKRLTLPEGRRNNPALLEKGGLSAMAADMLSEYMAQACPEAYALFHRLQVESKPQRLALITHARNRILECDDSGRRRPVAVTGGIWPTTSYKSDKTVYAEHPVSKLTEGNPNLWWELSMVDDKNLPSAFLVRSTRGEAYLGVYSYVHWSRYTKFGRVRNLRDEVGVDKSKSNKRAWWRLLIRQDKGEGKVMVLLRNMFTDQTLNVTGVPQDSERQVFVDGAPDTNNDKAFLPRLAG